jgi:hypothetical protein
METRACFMPNNFYKYEGDLEYKIRMYRTMEKDKYIANFCSCSDQEIRDHINFLNNFSDKERSIQFSPDIIEVEPGLTEITLRIIGPNKWHRLVLIWTRYLFEDPFQAITKEAHRFSRETGTDLFESEQICFRSYKYTGNHNHTLFGNHCFKIIKTSDFLEKFNSLKSEVPKEYRWGGTTNNPSLQTLWEIDKSMGFEMDLPRERDKENTEENWIKRKKIYERVKELWK